VAPKIYPRSRWLAPPPTSPLRRQPLFRFLPSLLRPSNRDRQTSPGRLHRFFRLLIGPHATRRAQLRLWGLRHETIPAFRHRAQARVYRAIVQQQARRAHRRISGKRGILELLFLGRRGAARRLGGGRAEGSQLVQRAKALRAGEQAPDAPASLSMSQYESSAPTTWGAGSGGRRKRVYEYLKAANELRQTYTAQWAAQRNNQNEDYYNTPGAFSDVEIARSGNEEMVLFPSYARRVLKDKRPEVQARERRDSTSTIDEYRGVSDYPEPASEWTRYEDEHAVVAVDVRGWVYAPHHGPMSRKHRLLIALARKLSGIPAPNNTSADDGNANVSAESSTKTNGPSEEEMVDQEMRSLINNAEKSADPAWKGSTSDDPSSSASSEKQMQQSSQLSRDELTVANAHLMERLRPFLTNPRAAMPVTVFFYNDEQSQSRNIMTDESGHFNLRATLPFVPTHIRVLASEELSATKEIQIIEPTGVSLISDIDDTVKHSAITNGAKEIFRNTFVRELAELNVDGVTDWYNTLAKMGVSIHYVSNAPWQLYPLLERYFKLVGLPPGSFHLKQYSGMLQGIFEPTAERKRGSLEQILRDFPERKFILVGDSGEADLEVYTDIVLAYPGRILGIFIRDVTTSDHKDFFDKSVDHLEGVPTRSHSSPQLIDDSDEKAKRPALPPRRPRESPGRSADAISIDNGDLIDLRDELEEKNVSSESLKPANFRTPPLKPSKPSSLRAVTTNSESTGKGASSEVQDIIRRKPVPPVPPRRQIPTNQEEPSTPSPSYAGGVMNAVHSVANSLPGATNQLPFRPKGSDGNGAVDEQSDTTKLARSKQAPPPPPPRRTNTGASTATSDSPGNRSATQKLQSYPASAAAAAYQFASERLNWSASPAASLRSRASIPSLSRSSTNPVNNERDSSVPPLPLPNKREELWRRRWERANELLAEQGVVLGSWRVGKDAQDVSVWLVQQAMKDIQDGSKTHSNPKT
jgi:phosphatidate phosphatase APP1